MSGLKDDMKDIEDILKKRERILNDTLRSQEAYWLMLKNNNFQQISDMFQQTNRSIQMISELDASIREAADSFSQKTRDHVQKELSKQAKILKSIIEQEKKISSSLRQKKIKISESLNKNRKEMSFTKAYSQNMPKDGLNKYDKKI